MKVQYYCRFYDDDYDYDDDMSGDYYYEYEFNYDERTFGGISESATLYVPDDDYAMGDYYGGVYFGWYSFFKNIVAIKE